MGAPSGEDPSSSGSSPLGGLSGEDPNEGPRIVVCMEVSKEGLSWEGSQGVIFWNRIHVRGSLGRDTKMGSERRGPREWV